jgi:hypothetical protein
LITPLQATGAVVRHIVSILCVFACVVVSVIANDQPTREDNVITITLPADWVPFQADVFHTHDGGITTGRFHRRRDGSTAYYLDTPGGVAITIHNLQTGRTYVKLGYQGWRERGIDSVALAKPQTELRLPRKQVHVIPDSRLGDIYEFTNARGGAITRLVPALNGFHIAFLVPDGVRREYLNIRIGDQPDALFSPSP